MTSQIRAVAAGLMLAGTLAFAAASGQAGGELLVWKSFVPVDAAKEMAQRSLSRIGTLAKRPDAEGIELLRAEAVILAGLTLTRKDGTDVDKWRPGAAKLATLAGKKGAAEEAGKLGAALSAGSSDVEFKVASWRDVIGDLKPLMTLFESKAKKGEGLHSDLHYSAKIKNANGIEALIYALADKKLSDANAAKVSKEMEMLAYRVAVLGEITRVRGPGGYPKTDKKDDKKPDAKIWIEQSVVMRDAGVEWAEAARKKDSAGILEACKRLENSCVECHAEFK